MTEEYPFGKGYPYLFRVISEDIHPCESLGMATPSAPLCSDRSHNDNARPMGARIGVRNLLGNGPNTSMDKYYGVALSTRRAEGREISAAICVKIVFSWPGSGLL